MDDFKTFIPLNELKLKIKGHELPYTNVQDFFDDLNPGDYFYFNSWLENSIIAGFEYSIKALLVYNSFLNLEKPIYLTTARILLYYTAFHAITSLNCYQGRYLKPGNVLVKYDINDNKFVLNPYNSRKSSHRTIWNQFEKLYKKDLSVTHEWDLITKQAFLVEYDFCKVRNTINYTISGGFKELEENFSSLRQRIWTYPSYNSIVDIKGDFSGSPFFIDFNSTNKNLLLNSEEVYSRLLMIAALETSAKIFENNLEFIPMLKKAMRFIHSGERQDILPETLTEQLK
ncbi:MAG: hypothetical protein PHC34_09075 [Candidatus Gastranaerophilales bacterium]|nr:hypothetical protein [Candidatus Gastranaerophilales bacterium]